ncbi:hypothetical protein WR25_22986 [Diploscapter pachys]|uniref:G-protein coupled receptors family 1 profile domain-containing protein n=1 Tax=Diploscapter pachys TaxID=2018661 RepID=A0A2A2KDR3_9BILA|nr:hypothetical protein WR25_22986 [Diploscapter pachys]
MSSNFTNICLNDSQMIVHGSYIEYNLQRYFYPAIAIFGILGNIINLTVLLNKSMRSRANTFLSVLAFSDIFFLSFLFPNILANYRFFMLNYYFRFFYFYTKAHIRSLANCCSAVAIWCVIAVCTDRLVGIRSPLYARATWSWWKMPLVIFCIVFLCGLSTLYQHLEYFCLVRLFCHDTQLYSQCLHVTQESWFGNRTSNPYSKSFRSFISKCVLIYPILMIIFPIILLTLLNVMLLYHLRKRQKHLAFGADKAGSKSNSHQFQKTEHRVTLTVSFIVTMFTITNGPSAFIHIIEGVYDLPENRLYYNIKILCSTLVICGKASNFILFCLGSKHFRLRLIRLTQKKMHKKIESLTGSLMPGGYRETTITNGISRDNISYPRRQSVPSQKSSTSLIMSNGKCRAASSAGVESIYQPLIKGHHTPSP